MKLSKERITEILEKSIEGIQFGIHRVGYAFYGGLEDNLTGKELGLDMPAKRYQYDDKFKAYIEKLEKCVKLSLDHDKINELSNWEYKEDTND